MEIRTSYFYQIRFFKHYMIPVSTAVTDPKWFHGFCSSSFVSLDKNRVLNGLRCKWLMPDESCRHKCKGQYMCGSQPDSCEFLSAYKRQLDTLDFDFLMKDFKSISDTYKKLAGLDRDPMIVLIVHEAPNNRCSERSAIQGWFRQNGVVVEELKYPITENY